MGAGVVPAGTLAFPHRRPIALASPTSTAWKAVPQKCPATPDQKMCRAVGPEGEGEMRSRPGAAVPHGSADWKWAARSEGGIICGRGGGVCFGDVFLRG